MSYQQLRAGDLSRAAGDFNEFEEIDTLNDDDVLLLEDSSDGYAKKRIKLSDLKAYITE